MENKYQEALDKIKESLNLAIIKASENLIGIEDTTHMGYINQMQELVDKQTSKKALERHYEDKGEKPYIKVCCPNGCHVQVGSYYKYCPECAQKLDWSDEDE